MRSNVLNRLDTSKFFKSLDGTRRIDVNSIMCYRIDRSMLKDEFKDVFPTNG